MSANSDSALKNELFDTHKKVSAELRQTRLDFLRRVECAVAMKSPTRRKELYQCWRVELCDISAREAAKFAEAVIAGEDYLFKFKDKFSRGDK